MADNDNARTGKGRNGPLSIAQYLDLRSRFSANEIQIWNENGNEWYPWWENNFKNLHGITSQEINGWVGCVPEVVSSISLKILKAMDLRKLAEEAGETHLVSKGFIDDSLIAVLISKQFEMMDWHGNYEVNKDFLFLIRAFLKAENSKYAANLHSYMRRHDASFASICLNACNRPVTIRNIAKLLDVEPSTVSRWFPNGLPYKKDDETTKSTDSDDIEKQNSPLNNLLDIEKLTKEIDTILGKGQNKKSNN